jgi:DNA-binding response OmpR family regulator
MGLFDNTKILFGIKKVQATETPPPKKILIVEDEKSLGDSLETKLKEEKFIVLRAENGEAGLKTAVAEKPDVVVLDLVMPVMDGKTMLHELRKIPGFEKLPVIVLTNVGTVDNMRDTKFYDGASDFLIKTNVTLDEVASRVKQLTGF